jgi:hypothetical protein
LLWRRYFGGRSDLTTKHGVSVAKMARCVVEFEVAEVVGPDVKSRRRKKLNETAVVVVAVEGKTRGLLVVEGVGEVSYHSALGRW